MLRLADISNISYPSFGGILVKYEDEILGEWAGPDMHLKKDHEGKLYYEINIEYINYDIGE